MKINDRYVDRETAACVNGIAILFVFLRHVLGYRSFAAPVYLPLQLLSRVTGQMIVVSFLFFSGFGIMEACRQRGDTYVAGLPRHRILKTWLRFAMAVGCYALLGLAMGKHYTSGKLVLSFLGWESVGNSNWYMFVILWLYLFTWLSMVLAGRKNTGIPRERSALGLMWIFTGALILGLSLLREDYWYNTALVYPFGMWFSVNRGRLEAWQEAHPEAQIPMAAVILVLWGVLFRYRNSLAAYEAASILCAVTMLLILRRFPIRSRILSFLGRHLFGFYMGQRFFMIVLRDLPMGDGIYLLLCVICALLFGWVLDIVTGKLAAALVGQTSV